ncbi:hypothetical protein JCM10908_003199 [Rhodotorula pacifica]|uniref:zinc finger MYND domain-containing protein n=1 Tax=Rhodotorula pacifica TaxID=1495444 RepID=UPI00317B11B6
MTETAPNGIKTLRLSWKSDPDLDNDKPRIGIGKSGDAFVLAVADKKEQEERFYGGYISSLSVIVHEDPFPGLSMSGKQMIWVKNYSENEGIVAQLEKAGFLRLVGSKIKQGFVELPLAEVTLEDSEMIQQCAMRDCEKWETTETSPRFKRCSKCHRRYYHQHQDWPSHKIDCKDLVKLRFTDVENRKRAAMWTEREDAAAKDGVKTVTLTL